MALIPTFLTSVSFPREELVLCWWLAFSFFSPSAHPSTLPPISGLLMLESRVETQMRESSPSVPRSSHCGYGRSRDYFSDDACVLCRGTDWKEFRGFSERVFVMCLVVCTACRIYEHLEISPHWKAPSVLLPDASSPWCQRASAKSKDV